MTWRIWIATLMATSLSAFCWDANVDYIYWKASGSEIPWVSTAGPVAQAFPHESTDILRPDYTSGVRVQVDATVWGCWSLGARYEWLESTDRAGFTRASDFAMDIIGQPDIAATDPTISATAVQSLPIHIAEVFAAHPVTSGCWGSLDFFAGATFLYARRSFTARYIDPVSNVPATEARTRFSGAGPLVGLRTVYHTFACLDVTTELGLLTVIGEVVKSNTTAVVASTPSIASYKPTTTSSVGGLLRLGGQVFLDRCGIRLLGTLGWEHRLYLGVATIGHRLGAASAVTAVADDFAIRNLFVGGPYIGIGAKF